MIEKLQKALRENEDYRYGWQANIAMAFIDEYGRCKKRYKSRRDIHEMANVAAKNFLGTLMADGNDVEGKK